MTETASEPESSTASPTPDGIRGPRSFPMRDRRPTVGNGVVLFSVIALAPIYMAGAGVLAAKAVPVEGRDVFAVGVGVAFVALGIALAATLLLLRRRRRRLVRGPAVLEHDAIRFTPASNAEPVHIAFADVTSLQRVVLPPGLSIGTRAGVTSVGDAEFVDGDVARHIEDAIRAAVTSMPDGAARVAAIDRQTALTSAITQRSAAATNTLLAALGAWFALEFATGAFDDVGRMLALGANAPGLVKQGQLWRLVTAGFLHANVIHIAMNATALLSFGGTLERLVGRHRFLLVAILASIGGNIASAAVGAHGFSVGASSCVWGLIGALFVVQRRARAALHDALVVQPRRWAFILGVNGLISLLPGVDLLAHVGGFATGAALALVFLRDLDVRSPRASRSLVGVTAVVVVATVGCFAFALSRAARLDDDARTNDVLDMALAVKANPAVVNSGAWAVVKSGTNDRALLARAERGQRVAVEEAEAARLPMTEAGRDTLAWLRFRQGAIDDAIAIERQVLTHEPKASIATALARFLRAGSPSPLAAVTIVPATPGTVTIDAGASKQARMLYVELGDLGLWCVPLPAGDGPTNAVWPAGVPADAVAAPRLLSRTGLEIGARDGSQWFPRDATTAALP